MTPHLAFFGSLLLISALFAQLEIEIEGPHGWAENLPTWRFSNRWTRRLVGNRDLTGYHVYFIAFVLAMLHLPFGIGLVGFSVAAELRILAFFCFFWILEDFLWFVLNPAYGITGFRRGRIHWHAANWWWFMPRDYWIFMPVAVLLYILSWRLQNGPPA